jgi:hypothetical protein
VRTLIAILLLLLQRAPGSKLERKLKVCGVVKLDNKKKKRENGQKTDKNLQKKKRNERQVCAVNKKVKKSFYAQLRTVRGLRVHFPSRLSCSRAFPTPCLFHCSIGKGSSAKNQTYIFNHCMQRTHFLVRDGGEEEVSSWTPMTRTENNSGLDVDPILF